MVIDIYIKWNDDIEIVVWFSYTQNVFEYANVEYIFVQQQTIFQLVTGPKSGSLGSVICTGRLVSGGVQVIWSCKYTDWPYVCTDFYSV